MIVLALFPLFAIYFSPFLKYRTCQYFIFKFNNILFLNYFMCVLFLQTSLTTPLRIRIWLSLLFLYHICLYNARKIKCAGQGHLSSATSPCTTFSVLPDTAKLSSASLILWLQIFAHFIMFSFEKFSSFQTHLSLHALCETLWSFHSVVYVWGRQGSVHVYHNTLSFYLPYITFFMLEILCLSDLYLVWIYTRPEIKFYTF